MSVERHDAIEATLSIVERLLRDERSRGQALETKTVSIAGFSGVVLALTANFGRAALRLDLGGVGSPILRISFVLAVVGTISAAALALRGVLRPQRYLGLTLPQVAKFPQAMVVEDRHVVQGRMVSTIALDLIKREREVNNRNAAYTRWSGIALLVGLSGIAGQALTVVIADWSA